MPKIAVLVSGGLDSCLLVAQLLGSNHQVHPLYLQHGLHWESTEKSYLRRFLKAVTNLETVANNQLKPLTLLQMPVGDMYQSHWSVTGENVPDEYSDDSAVYLPGRNLLLLAKASVWCALNNIDTIALGSLRGNPFSDNSDEFYNAISDAITIATRHKITIVRPFSDKTKEDIVANAKMLPLHLTFSCIKPIDNKHCGTCNKCAERKAAFTTLGIEDRTVYCQ